MANLIHHPDGVVVHYHEIALKGENRPFFIRQLAENIQRSTSGLGVNSIKTPRGRVVLSLIEEASWSEIAKRLRKVFGIANFSPVWRSSPRMADLRKNVSDLIKDQPFKSFKIAARRGHKGHPLTSVEINEKLGRFVQELTQARVDLEHPEKTIFVEILKDEALIYFEKQRGPGGLPVGVSGTVACLLSGGIDSPVAAHRMMKRGCNVVFIHFHSHPYLTKASAEKAEELAELLTDYQFNSKLYLIPFGEVQRQIVLTVPPPLRVVLYRRFMLRITEEIALRERAKALVTGESLGQVASQTLENIAAIEEAANLPVLRPLIGLDKEEIIALAQSMGSFEISILPDQDCCRLFIPPHPSVRSRLDDVRRAESRLDIHGLVKMGLDLMEIQSFNPHHMKIS